MKHILKACIYRLMNLGIFLTMTKQETENYFYIKKKFETLSRYPYQRIYSCACKIVFIQRVS